MLLLVLTPHFILSFHLQMHFMMTVAFEHSVCFHCRYESVVTFETQCFDAKLLIFFFLVIFPGCACLLVCVIVHGCVKVYER